MFLYIYVYTLSLASYIIGGYSMITRRDRIERIINNLTMGESTVINMFPSEYRRFKKEYPSMDFEITGTEEKPGYKSHRVKVTF